MAWNAGDWRKAAGRRPGGVGGIDDLAGAQIVGPLFVKLFCSCGKRSYGQFLDGATFRCPHCDKAWKVDCTLKRVADDQGAPWAKPLSDE